MAAIIITMARRVERCSGFIPLGWN